LTGLAAARANEWDKKTLLTVNEPIQVPNKILAPGHYVIKLLNSSGNRNIVQIFTEHEFHLIVTVFAVPSHRELSDKNVFTFWETPPGVAKALRAWFYQGDEYGQEFVYPKGFIESLRAGAQPHPLAAQLQRPEVLEVAQQQPIPIGQLVAAEANLQQETASLDPSELVTPRRLSSGVPLIGFGGLLALSTVATMGAPRWP
jgi:hypothetical protein